MSFQKDSSGDINSLEDRLWALSNTIAIEEHALSSYFRTKDPIWLKTAYTFRDMRKSHMEYILGKASVESQAEIWCMTKHALSAAMRYSETAARYEREDPAHCAKCLEDSRRCIKLLLRLLEAGRGLERRNRGSDVEADAATEPDRPTPLEPKNLDLDSSGSAKEKDGKTKATLAAKIKKAILTCCRE